MGRWILHGSVLLVAAAAATETRPWETGPEGVTLVLAGVVLELVRAAAHGDPGRPLWPIVAVLGLLVGGPSTAVAVAVVGSCAATTDIGRLPWDGVVASVASAVVAVVVGGSSYALVTGRWLGPDAPADSPRWLIGVAFALVAIEGTRTVVDALTSSAAVGASPSATAVVAGRDCLARSLASVAIVAGVYVTIASGNQTTLAFIVTPLVAAGVVLTRLTSAADRPSDPHPLPSR